MLGESDQSGAMGGEAGGGLTCGTVTELAPIRDARYR